MASLTFFSLGHRRGQYVDLMNFFFQVSRILHYLYHSSLFTSDISTINCLPPFGPDFVHV